MKPLYEIPLKLEKNRVYRPFIGGKLLEEWQEDEKPKDSHYGERWISSLTKALSTNSDDKEGLSKVISENRTLKEIIEEYPARFLGKHFEKYGNNLGVLVKVLDSYSRLLIQVHPDKRLAKKLFDSQFGKTEAWYILDTREVNGEKPYILFGFKKGVTKEVLEEAFYKQDIKAIEGMMHKFYVKPGDVFFIEGGMPHAIGSGCFLVEIQEPTDYTIRVEKMAPDGRKIDDFSCHQGLGFEKMFECFNYKGYTREFIENKWKIQPKVLMETMESKVEMLIGKEQTSLFEMQRVVVKSVLQWDKGDRFAIAIVLKGSGELACKDFKTTLAKADEVFIPYEAKELKWVNYGNEEMELIICFPPYDNEHII